MYDLNSIYILPASYLWYKGELNWCAVYKALTKYIVQHVDNQTSSPTEMAI